MARGAQAPLPEPPFSVLSTHPPTQIPPSDLRAGSWAAFTSRHEAMHSNIITQDEPQDSPKPIDESSAPSDTAEHCSDSEAEAVKHWAVHHQNSDSESTDEAQGAVAPQMYACNGPWSALHRATKESTDAYFEDRHRSAQTLQPMCGCKLGIAAMAVWTSDPCNVCRRNGCA